MYKKSVTTGLRRSFDSSGLCNHYLLIDQKTSEKYGLEKNLKQVAKYLLNLIFILYLRSILRKDR
jgi:hypothetical protein